MVYIQKVDTYDKAEIEKAIDEIFEKHDICNIVKKGTNVCIKPNFVMKKKVEDSATTNPVIIYAVAEKLIKLGANVVLAESPGGPYNARALEDMYKFNGLMNLEKMGAKLNLDIECKRVKSSEGNVFDVIKPVAEADVVINLAKLKTHMMMNMTACTKNLFGIIPGTRKAEYHATNSEYADFASKIIEICSLVPNQICILDCIDTMEGNGPTAGTTRHLGYMMSSLSPYEIDHIACQMIQFEEISHINQKVLEKGLITGYNIDVQGLKLEDIVVNDFKRPEGDGKTSFKWKLLQKISGNFKPYPIFDMKKCIKCKRCIENCPKNIIELKKGKLVIDKKKCISCFCCQELCPQKAVRAKRSIFFNL